MRILYICNYQGPRVVAQRGQRRNRALGAGRKVELLARGLGARGHEVHVVSAGTVRESTCRLFHGLSCVEPECGGARVSYLPAIDIPRANLLVASAMLRQFLASAEECDVVILYNLELYFVEPVIEFARARDLPLVIEYEDDALGDIGVRFQRWHEARGRKAIALARERCDGVVAVSPELGRQIGHANTVVISGVVGEDLLGIERTRGGRGLARVVYTGGIQPEKGADLLVAAAELVRRPIEIDIVGAGSALPDLRKQATQVSVPLRVHGEVARSTLVELLAQADLAVNPHRMTRDRPGQIFPFKVCEYLGAGLPVVSSRLGEIPGELRGALAMYCDDSPECLAQAIEGAVDDIPELAVAAAAARRWVAREYSDDAAARKVEAVLQTALDGLRATKGRHAALDEASGSGLPGAVGAGGEVDQSPNPGP